MNVLHYINLTNGIDLLNTKIDVLLQKHIPNPHAIRFVRIQSTTCEQHNWSKLIEDLDNDLLMHLAIGTKIIVMDCANHRTLSRALRVGLSIIKGLCEYFWTGTIAEPIRIYRKSGAFMCNLTDRDFVNIIRKLSITAKKKLRYFKKFYLGEPIVLRAFGCSTHFDGDYEHYREIIKAIYKTK